MPFGIAGGRRQGWNNLEQFGTRVIFASFEAGSQLTDLREVRSRIAWNTRGGCTTTGACSISD